MSSNKVIIKRIENVLAEELEQTQKTTLKVLLGPNEGMQHFYTRQFDIQAGGWIKAHQHDTLEHQQVVLDGQMVLTLDGQERIVSAGDCVYIPPRVVHAYQNKGQEAVRFLCMVPAMEYQTEWVD